MIKTSKFSHFIANHPKKVCLMDGAMGTLLQSNQAPEYTTLISPLQVTQAHQAYIKSGSQVILTNTFGLGRLLATGQIESEKLDEYVSCSVTLAIDASATKDVLCLGSIGPLASKEDSSETIIKNYKTVIDAFLKTDSDGLLFETQYQMEEASLLLDFLKNKPVSCPWGMTFTPTNNKTKNENKDQIKILLEKAITAGASIIGLNCGNGPTEMIDLFFSLGINSSLPFIIKPNNGLPKQSDHEFAKAFLKLKDLKKDFLLMLGGCCGTTPKTILELAGLFE